MIIGFIVIAWLKWLSYCRGRDSLVFLLHEKREQEKPWEWLSASWQMEQTHLIPSEVLLPTVLASVVCVRRLWPVIWQVQGLVTLGILGLRGCEVMGEVRGWGDRELKWGDTSPPAFFYFIQRLRRRWVERRVTCPLLNMLHSELIWESMKVELLLPGEFPSSPSTSYIACSLLQCYCFIWHLCLYRLIGLQVWSLVGRFLID